ncbi:murein hydrolase activator EnvC family protein [bacterium]
MKQLFIKKFLIVLILFSSATYAQRQTDIRSVQQELQKLEAELKSKNLREKTLFTQVEDLEREIGLRQKLLDALETERRIKEKAIANKESSLRDLNRTREGLQAIIRKRIIRIYKRGRLGEWEALFVMKSLNQLMVWLKYNKRIFDNDKRNLQRLMQTKQIILDETAALESELQEKERLIRVKTTEAEKLETQKTSRGDLLSRVRKDQQSLQEQIRLKRIAYQTIRGEINRREAAKRTASVTSEEGRRFAALKGKMPWPVKGRIVTRYGKKKDPNTKVELYDRGIEIKATDREAVHSVSSGAVMRIDWLPGMGNIIFLNHGGGYYTVYAHLDAVLVYEGQQIGSREMMGYVGDRHGLYRSNLHFEIWNEKTDVNPELWLRK